MTRPDPLPLWQAVSDAKNGLPLAFAARWPVLKEFCRDQRMTMLVYEVVARDAASKDFVRFQVDSGNEEQRDALHAAGWIEDPRWHSLKCESGTTRAVAFAPGWHEGDLSEMQPEATVESVTVWLRSIDGLAPLVGFESLATLLTIGVGWSEMYGRVARLEWRGGNDRLDEQERFLRERGFSGKAEDPATWGCNESLLSMVFMGGTLYSHLGPLPQRYGGWPMDAE